MAREKLARVPVASHVVVWLARATWLGVAIIGGQAVGEALSGHSRSVQLTGTAGAWIGWTAAAVGLTLPGVKTLTLVRATVPGALVVATGALIDRGDAATGTALVIPAVIATALVSSAEFGRFYLQASAYGDEARFGLRPPIGYLGACVLSWLIAAPALMVAPLALAGRAWIPAVLCTAVAFVGTRLLPRRWHQLSRRWLVFVPAGVVVHDPVVLADTLMTPRVDVASVDLDDVGVPPAGGADLTGPTPGLAVEVRLRKPVTAVLAPTPKQPDGTAIRLHGFVVSPTRPGSAVRTARAAGYN